MKFHIDRSQLEDKLINPLNNILMLSYGSTSYKDVEKEIRRVINVLEKEHLINKRIH